MDSVPQISPIYVEWVRLCELDRRSKTQWNLHSWACRLPFALKQTCKDASWRFCDKLETRICRRMSEKLEAHLLNTWLVTSIVARTIILTFTYKVDDAVAALRRTSHPWQASLLHIRCFLLQKLDTNFIHPTEPTNQSPVFDLPLLTELSCRRSDDAVNLINQHASK